MENDNGAIPADQELDAWSLLAREGTFEDAMTALEQIVQLLDAGSLPLETSVRCFEIGSRLSERCTTLLEQAKLRVSALDADGLLIDVPDQAEIN